MKQFILFILVLLPVCAFAQFTETFDGPILNAGWIGGRDSFLIEGGQLKIKCSWREKWHCFIEAYHPLCLKYAMGV